jgi:biotin-dependent carboxylase-like uncharacterized protein
MQSTIEVIDGGLGNSIQDAGRFGFRHMGITVSGCLDPMLARCANALVGNSPDCAGIEIRGAGPTLEATKGRVRLALAGEIDATLRRASGESFAVPAWTSVTLDPHDVLEVGYLPGGTAFLAVSGGIDSPSQLGSRSTYQRAMIGGIDGKPIVTGNLLPCSSQPCRDRREFTAPPWRHDAGPMRVILGPQQGHFKQESVEQFLGTEYKVSTQIDRMGVRLDGVALMHISAQAADIVSDGVTPGVIQVPGNGQPIILLADCQTVGGYPKIATVICADLPRLAQLQPGQSLRFCAVNAAQAKAALLERERRWNGWAYAISFELPGATINRDLTAGWPSAIE